MDNVFAKARESAESMIKYNTNLISQAYRAEALLGFVEGIEDVGHLSTSEYGESFNIDLYLSADKKSSPLVHKLAQHFGVRFEKSPDLYGSLSASATIETAQEKVALTVRNYLPATCRVEEVEEEIPEDQVKRTRVVRKVVCE